MAINLEREGVALNAAERNKRNANLTKIEDALNEVGAAVPAAEAAKLLSEEAKAQAIQAEERAAGVETQLNEIVVNGDSSVEAAQARVRSDGTVAATLKARLDGEHQEVTTKLAETEKKVTVLNYLPNDLTGFAQNALIATPERTVNLSWNPSDWFLGSLATATGANFSSTIRIRTIDFKEVESNTKYIVFIEATDDGDSTNESLVNVFEYRADDSLISSTGWIANEHLFTTSAETSKIKMLVRNVAENITITTDYIEIAKPIMSKVY